MREFFWIKCNFSVYNPILAFLGTPSKPRKSRIWSLQSNQNTSFYKNFIAEVSKIKMVQAVNKM